MMRHALLARQSVGVMLWLAAALVLRGDVLVLTNGSLLLGRVQSMTDAGIEVALGPAGSTTVRKSDMRLLIPCPSSEEPDSYLKAGQRAERSELVAEALACYEKSLAVEPANAIAATSCRADLQKRIVGDTKAKRSAPPASSIEARRAEAQRLIREADEMLARAKMAAGFQAPHSGSTEASVASWGATLKAQGEAMKAQGEQMLAQIEKETVSPTPTPAPAHPLVPPPVSSPPPTEPTVGGQTVNWLKVIGVAVLILIVVRVLFHPFLSRK